MSQQEKWFDFKSGNDSCQGSRITQSMRARDISPKAMPLGSSLLTRHLYAASSQFRTILAQTDPCEYGNHGAFWFSGFPCGSCNVWPSLSTSLTLPLPPVECSSVSTSPVVCVALLCKSYRPHLLRLRTTR